MTDPDLARRVHEALMRVAEESGEHPAAVLTEALFASATVLSAGQCPRQVARIYRRAIQYSRHVRSEMNRQGRAGQVQLIA